MSIRLEHNFGRVLNGLTYLWHKLIYAKIKFIELLVVSGQVNGLCRELMALGFVLDENHVQASWLSFSSFLCFFFPPLWSVEAWMRKSPNIALGLVPTQNGNWPLRDGQLFRANWEPSTDAFTHEPPEMWIFFFFFVSKMVYPSRISQKILTSVHLIRNFATTRIHMKLWFQRMRRWRYVQR